MFKPFYTKNNIRLDYFNNSSNKSLNPSLTRDNSTLHSRTYSKKETIKQEQKSGNNDNL
jgi:hypothetical protein